MADKSKPRKKLDSMSNRLEFHYKKSNYFRVIKVNGAWGGLTPNSDVQMSIFSERLPLPDLDEYEISDGGKITKLVRKIAKTKGVIREVEATLTMTPSVAKALGEWLLDKAAQYEKYLDSPDDEKTKEVEEAENIELAENK
jgi:hypothetical protein